jgi:Fe-S oxidoreductase
MPTDRDPRRRRGRDRVEARPMSDPNAPISYRPTEGLTYDPADAAYWDTGALALEIRRTFEICQGCRLCFKFCDAFPALFRFVDGALGGDVRRIDASQTRAVMDSCFQCKLCEVQCPYSVRDGHEYQLDFPRLVHRYRAQRVRSAGLGLRQRLLANPDRAGALARASLGLAGALDHLAVHRWFLEKALGIHRRKLLPRFARRSFESWAARAGLVQGAPGGEAVLFQTCYVQHNQPDLGRDTVAVLQRNRVDVRCVRGLVCCGMPAWEQGDLAALQARASRNLERLVPFVEAGAKVVVVNPTCSMMLRREYPELVAPGDRERARRLAAAVRDASEFLWSIRGEKRFDAGFKSTPGTHVAYHAPCHLRAQGVGFKGRDLLRTIPGVVPVTTLECCGHDGTWAMTKRGFEPSQRIGKKAFDGMRASGAGLYVTDCPLAALQFEQHAGKRALHPMSVLARAYREDGFPERLPPARGGPRPPA